MFSKSAPSAINDMAPSSGQGMEQLRNKISELERQLSEVTAYITFCFCGKHCFTIECSMYKILQRHHCFVVGSLGIYVS